MEKTFVESGLYGNANVNNDDHDRFNHNNESKYNGSSTESESDVEIGSVRNFTELSSSEIGKAKRIRKK